MAQEEVGTLAISSVVAFCCTASKASWLSCGFLNTSATGSTTPCRLAADTSRIAAIESPPSRTKLSSVLILPDLISITEARNDCNYHLGVGDRLKHSIVFI